MSTLAADVAFGDFTFPSCEPSAPEFSFDPSFYQIPYNPNPAPQPHARPSSRGSIYSAVSAYSAASTPDSVSTRMTTPPRASTPSSVVRHHGPILLPKIRSQDQVIQQRPAAGPARTIRKSASPCPRRPAAAAAGVRKSHARSYTNPETLSYAMQFIASQQQFQQHQPLHHQQQQQQCHPEDQQSLLCSPAIFTTPTNTPTPEPPARRSQSCGVETGVIERYGFPTYRQMPAYHLPVTTTTTTAEAAPAQSEGVVSYNMYSPPPGASEYAMRSSSPLSFEPEPAPTTTLLAHLTAPNPAPSLVRTISYHHRDPATKHFWWDVRQVRPWTAFAAPTILSLPGAHALLSCPVALPLLPPAPAPSSRHPETEAALHALYAQHYLPRLNSALALSSTQPLHLTACTPKAAAAAVPSSTSTTAASSSPSAVNDLLFVANGPGDGSSAAAIFGGKPTARVVGLVRSFDRFNTGMRVEGAIKRVEYLRGLAALHHAMREHSCRYGFILTEIELVVVRNGTDPTPHFGYVEVATIQLANSGPDSGSDGGGPSADDVLEALRGGSAEMTACLALWGLCMLASDDVHASSSSSADAHPSWRSEIGAPAEGTRRKALPRDEWMPKPQLAEKREAKRARGWVMPEDAVGRKELGKRGVRYTAC